MSENSKPRRIIVPVQRSNDATVVIDRVGTVAGMLDRALNIIDEQLTKLGSKSRQGGPNGFLDDKETRALHGHIKALVELSKEEREREKHDKSSEKLENLTDAELLELAQSELADTKSKI